MYLLQRHGLPIKANLHTSLVLTYALPAMVLAPLLPPGLTLDTFGDFAFVAIALVETHDLRPAILPAGCGMNFFLSGYRIFTRYRTQAGRSLRGLLVLRSDTNRWLMQFFGNLLTHYRYELSTCDVLKADCHYKIRVKTPDGKADLRVDADLGAQHSMLPPHSPFANVTEARKFAGPLPFTFYYEKQTHSIIRIEGVRKSWNPRPVSVTVHEAAYLYQPPFRCASAVLANAFFLENVPYAWRPGIREKLS